MITRRGEVKILDFRHCAGPAEDTAITQLGIAVEGPWPYMSPEQTMGRRGGPAGPTSGPSGCSCARCSRGSAPSGAATVRCGSRSWRRARSRSPTFPPGTSPSSGRSSSRRSPRSRGNAIRRPGDARASPPGAEPRPDGGRPGDCAGPVSPALDCRARLRGPQLGARPGILLRGPERRADQALSRASKGCAWPRAPPRSSTRTRRWTSG